MKPLICAFLATLTLITPHTAIGAINADSWHFRGYTDQTLIALEQCESGRRTKIKVWDNGSWSFGVLQFKFLTMEFYSRRYGIRDVITEQDMYNVDLQRRVATEMLKEKNGIYHWYNCGKKLKLI